MISSDSLANLYSSLVIGIYILFFVLLVSANIALWKYIIAGGKRYKKDWKNWPDEKKPNQDEAKEK